MKGGISPFLRIKFSFQWGMLLKVVYIRDFPGGPVVKNPPSSAGDVGLICGWGTKIPHATVQLSPCTATTKHASHNYRALRATTTERMHSGAHAPQLGRSPSATTKSPCTTTKDPACHDKDPSCCN